MERHQMKKLLVTAAVALLCQFGGMDDAAADRGYNRGHHGGHGHYRGYRGWRGPRASFGLHFGAPLFWGPDPFYRPYWGGGYPGYYYPPRTVIIERDPPVYVQRTPAAPPATQVAQVWYYCPNPAGYYPHVANCSQQWVPVDPRSVPPAAGMPPG